VSGETRNLELTERLKLIEDMIAEGRRTVGRWGWIFVLWGVAFYVAFGWYLLGGHSQWAWPVTMTATFVLTRVLQRRRRASQPRTTVGRAIGSVWIAMVISMFVLFPAIGLSGSAVAPKILTAVLATMLGTSNAACGMLLKWKEQFACAAIWWASAAVCCFETAARSMIAFMIASFLCWIVFGIYVIVSEARLRQQQGAILA
jgi:hypothetical protein